MTDLEIVRGEAAPRSAATCRRVGGRMHSIVPVIAAGVLWLVIAGNFATLVLFAAFQVLPAHPQLALIGWFAVFALGWLPFVAWIVRRTRRARALVRDGVVVHGSIEHLEERVVRGAPFSHAAVRFHLGHEQHRAVFSAGGHGVSPGGEQPLLYAPGSAYAIAFLRDGRAVPAKIARDVTFDHGDTRTTVTLKRGTSETFAAVLLALMLVELTALGVRLTFFNRPAQLHCDRASDGCTVTGGDLWGTASIHFAPSAVTRSELRSNRDGELSWIVHLADGSTRQLGDPTSRSAQKDAYRQQADALMTFLADRARPTFDARFVAMGGDGPLMLAIDVVLAALLVLLLHGWRTTLAFDRAAGTLTITRTPALWSPSRQTVPLSRVARAESKAGGLFLLYASVPTLAIRLIGSDGKVLFRRRQATSDAVTRELAAINDLVAGGARAS